MTQRLYYQDAHLSRFQAVVVSCREDGGRWAVVLDRTAFFPEGGGQPADTGRLGDVAVLDVRERDGDVVHFCDGPLVPGREVEGVLNWPERFSRMQFHSGEHILSGIARRRWGCENVGFHMAPRLVTIDFNREFTPEELEELERLANEAVWANVPVRAFFPGPEELAALDYRSKKALAGPVRLVEIQGVDLCACCAPHVARTGEIGLIRLEDALRHRGGMRVTMLAGRAALEDAVEKARTVCRISRQLSLPREAIADGVERLQGELERLRAARAREELERLRRRGEALVPVDGDLCLFEAPGTGRDALRELANAGADKCGGICAVFAGCDGDGWQYILASRHVDLRSRARELNAAMAGRGGGSPEMIQGSAGASRKVLESLFGGGTNE